jgi:hypothetical protein
VSLNKCHAIPTRSVLINGESAFTLYSLVTMIKNTQLGLLFLIFITAVCTSCSSSKTVAASQNLLDSCNIATNGFLIGIYYFTGCDQETDGNQQQAKAIADLYKKWSGVSFPVFDLSNAEMRSGGDRPFSYPG